MSEKIFRLLCKKNNAETPFHDQFYKLLDSDEELLIACPYMGKEQLDKLINRHSSWRLLSDFAAMLNVIPAVEREDIIKKFSVCLDKICYVDGLHAKVALAGKAALIGSANFTKSGLTSNFEVGAVLEDADSIVELRKWFEDLFLPSDSELVEKLRNYSQKLAELEISECKIGDHALADLKTIANVKKHKSFPNKISELTEDTEAFSRLCALAKRKDVDRQFFNMIFDFIVKIIEKNGVDSNDPRFVISITKHPRISVSINQRWVFAALWNGDKNVRCDSFDMVFSILPSSSDLKYTDNETYRGMFKQKGKEKEKRYWVVVNMNKNQCISDKLENDWFRMQELELRRGQCSSYKKHHRPFLFDLAVNTDFRHEIFDQLVFSKN